MSSEPGVLMHHSIVDILTGSGATLLINLAVLSAAAAAFHNSGHVVITLQDAQALMEQVSDIQHSGFKIQLRAIVDT